MKRLLLLICTLLCANVLLAQTFWVDSLQYHVTSTSLAEVEVYDANQSIVIADIPATVTYQGRTYSVTAIGDEAFRYRNSLTSVTIPESITSISSLGIFHECSNLRTLNFNAINCADFEGYYPQSGYAVPITSLNIGNNVQRLPACFMTNADSLTSVNIPNSVIEIGSRAFMFCDNLTSVTLPENATISTNAFTRCGFKAGLTIDNGVIYTVCYDNENIGNYTFEEVNNVTFTIGDSVYTPSSAMVYYYTSELSGTVTLLSSITYNCVSYTVTSIDYSAFSGCSSLTSVNIPNTVTSIGYEAFRDCIALTSVSIGDGVNSIPQDCFKNCNILMNVNLGSNVNFISSGAFGNSQFLQNVTCLATTPPTISGNTAFPYPNTATLTIPCGSLNAYTAPNSLWSILFADRIREDCSGIEQAETESISFFPNPTKSEIIFSQAIEKVEVIDITGKTILTFTNAKTINIESLPAGAYYLRLTNNDKAIMRKVIKE